MSNIGIRDLVSKKISEIEDFVNLYIKSSLNIREGIILGEDPDICMLGLVRDTYMCNLILRYVGMMTLLSSNVTWTKIDNILTEYIQDYYNHKKFRKKIIELYEHYYDNYKTNKKDLDYCKFLDKMISKSDISKKSINIKKNIRMLENKVFNLLNIDPIVKISTRHLKNIPKHYEIKNDQAIVHISQKNYTELLDLIDDIEIRHQIEKQYTSRTKNAIDDFSKLIVLRKILADNSGCDSYFKYINRNKFDNSDSIKELITEMNDKLNDKTRIEIDKIYQYYSRTTRSNHKISMCDIHKYNRIHKNNTKFNPKYVFYVIFNIIESYFGIKTVRSNEKTWGPNVVVYELRDTGDDELLGRLYLDIIFDEQKK